MGRHFDLALDDGPLRIMIVVHGDRARTGSDQPQRSIRYEGHVVYARGGERDRTTCFATWVSPSPRMPSIWVCSYPG